MKIIINDSDILKYTMASLGEERTVLVTHKPSGRSKEFPNRSAFRGRVSKSGDYGGWLKEINSKREESGLPIFLLEDFEIEDIQKAQPIENNLFALKQYIENIKDFMGADEIRLNLGEGKSFRHKILLPWEGKDGQSRVYKGNRAHSLKPIHLQSVHDYLVKVKKANIITGVEVDDHLSMMSYKGHQMYLKTGNKYDNPYIQHTTDKDNCQVEGWLYNPNWMEAPMYIEGLGEMWKDASGKIRMIGRKSLYGQLLSQDVADNIYPKRTPNGQTNRYSENQMYYDLVDLKTDRECWALIVEKYKEWFGEEVVEYKAWDGSVVREDWIGWLQKHFDLYKMLRWEGDSVDISKIFDGMKLK